MSTLIPKPAGIDPKPGGLAHAAIHPVVMRVGNGPTPEELHELTPGQRSLYSIYWCVYEVCNGGFRQFFGNPTGVVAHEAVIGFRAVGSLQLASVVETAIAKFGPIFPADEGRRWDAMKRMPLKKDERIGGFDDLDDRFYEVLADGVALNQMRDRYVSEHPSGFFRSTK
ncbi:MAG: hypothetical protein FD180_201 [Planctomycetota bacterium]|nr:MAG: hypothetical protein FD180_201 [Planctomycetota bacterium]